MKRNSILILLLAVFLGLVGCSQKLPVPQSPSTGILVIPMKVTDNTGRSSFAYYYILNFDPDIPLKPTITPSTMNDFIIIDEFPVGKYKVTSLTQNGTNSSRIRAGISSRKRKLKDVSFEIKPGQATILGSEFVVTKRATSSSSWRESWGFSYLWENVLAKIKQLENAEHWEFKFSDKLNQLDFSDTPLQ